MRGTSPRLLLLPSCGGGSWCWKLSMKSNLCSSPISLASPLARISVSSRSNTRVLSVARARLVVHAGGSSPSLCSVVLLLLDGGIFRLQHEVQVRVVATAAAADLSATAGATNGAVEAGTAFPSSVGIGDGDGDGDFGAVVGLAVLLLPLYKLSNSNCSFSPSARTYAQAISNGRSIVEAAALVLGLLLLLLEEEGVNGGWLRSVHLHTMAADMTGTAAAIACSGNLLMWFGSTSKTANARSSVSQ
ncbi:unnamed protein product [Ectocarpus sp. 13 AM-2016]